MVKFVDKDENGDIKNYYSFGQDLASMGLRWAYFEEKDGQF